MLEVGMTPLTPVTQSAHCKAACCCLPFVLAACAVPPQAAAGRLRLTSSSPCWGCFFLLSALPLLLPAASGMKFMALPTSSSCLGRIHLLLDAVLGAAGLQPLRPCPTSPQAKADRPPEPHCDAIDCPIAGGEVTPSDAVRVVSCGPCGDAGGRQPRGLHFGDGCFFPTAAVPTVDPAVGKP